MFRKVQPIRVAGPEEGSVRNRVYRVKSRRACPEFGNAVHRHPRKHFSDAWNRANLTWLSKCTIPPSDYPVYFRVVVAARPRQLPLVNVAEWDHVLSAVQPALFACK